MRNIVLVGMMGAGKTTVAGALAGELGWQVVDTDKLIEERTGMTIAELFSLRGEGAFREAESAVIASLLGDPRPMVVSVGGGAVTREANCRAMRRLGTVVWLRAKPATLQARVGPGDGRPVLAAGGGQDVGARLVELAEQRRPLYEQVADLVVETDTFSPEQVADEIAQGLALCKR